MVRKRKTRELAMQVLFLWDTNGARDVEPARPILEEGTSDEEIRRSALEMATQTWEHREMIDQWVERLAPQWPPRRQPAVDRNLIRLAVWELTGTDTPPKVVIDEAIELAKKFSTEQSPAFVNGVIDAVLREHEAITQGKSC
jgi:N utilization substance protein B